DVRLMMPGKPDKKIPFCMSRSYYQGLIEAGVKIYEYNPGFLHSKSFVSDDKTSVAGTVNLDFRSLHLHYENGVLVYDKDFALTLKKDFIDTQKLCQEITITSFKELSIFYRLSGKMLRIFAPLM
uniref:phospholipase D-like domain-containing protein n=1 Tax=uncultured Helcococcus sp. TaxID=1072508 RepID=UPI00261DD784